MLEYNFNALDNDFITLWSKKLVGGEDYTIFKDLTKLAELGQINAIQCWYLIAGEMDRDKIIDKKVDNLRSGGPNELLAKANRDFYIRSRWRQLCAWDGLNSEAPIYRTEESERDFYKITRTLEQSDYVVNTKLAIDAYYNLYNQTGNLLYLERFFEMMHSLNRAERKLFDLKYPALVHKFSKFRRDLLELYRQDKSNIAVAFAVGKNLTLFKAEDRLKKMGTGILTKLSERDLSKTLQGYQISGNKQLREDESLTMEEVMAFVDAVKKEYGTSYLGKN